MRANAGLDTQPRGRPRTRAQAGPMHPSNTDPRAPALDAFVGRALDGVPFTRVPASSDASFRRYFRITPARAVPLAHGAPTLIAMDAPPPQEDCRPFVHV